MILYHGSNVEFDSIDLLKSKPNKDFGKGFYSSLRILRFDDYSEEWAKFIILNRNSVSKTAMHDYDVVIGPIANDTVGAQLWRYENKSIDLPTLVKNLHYIKGLTIQYFFGTEKAIKLLKRL